MADASLTQAEPTRSSRWGEVRDWVEITTPYLDRHNDFLQIYTKRQDCGSILTERSPLAERSGVRRSQRLGKPDLAEHTGRDAQLRRSADPVVWSGGDRVKTSPREQVFSIAHARNRGRCL